MGSPAYFGKLAAFEASLRKPALIPFGLFNVQDNLNFIASIPGSMTISQASITYSSALVIDTSVAQEISILLTGNVASSVLNYAGSSQIPGGQRVWIRFQQNATGGWTVALPANLVYDTGFAIDPGASRTTVLPIEWNPATSVWQFFSDPFSITEG